MNKPLLALACLLVTAPRAFAQPQPVAGPIATAADRIAPEWIAKRGGVGLSVCIAKDDQILVSRGYGVADAEWGNPVGEDTIFRVCSVSKQFEAAAILRLAEQHKLSLDDDFRKYIPEFPEKPHVITLRHLLSQTSGLPSYTDAPGFDDGPDGFGGVDHARTLSREEALAPVKDKPLAFEPGAAFQYSNTNSYLVGMVVEHATGKPYAQVFHDELAAPLGLRHTAYDEGKELLQGRAKGYQFIAGRLVHEPGPLWTNASAGGAIVSTAKELVQWNQALVSGRVISKDSYTLLTTPQKLANGKSAPYALNWWIDDFSGHRRFWHSGHGAGFNAMLAYFPDDHLTIAVLSNSTAIEAPDVARDLARAALDISIPAPVEKTMPEEALRAFTGTYMLGDGPAAPRVVVTLQDGHLVGDDGTHPPVRLICTGPMTFVFATDPTVRSTFSGAPGSPPVGFVLNDNGRASKWTRREAGGP
jgi:CubicO group peptidase (beta-lactamase class C family)